MSDQPVHHPDCKSKDPVTFPGGTICGCGRVVVKEAAAAPRVEETVGQLKFIAHGLSMFADFDDTGLPTERLRATAAWVREAADLLSSLSTEAAQLRQERDRWQLDRNAWHASYEAEHRAKVSAEAQLQRCREALLEKAEMFRIVGRAAPVDADAAFRTCADELAALAERPDGE
jgi:hypothetical protein